MSTYSVSEQREQSLGLQIPFWQGISFVKSMGSMDSMGFSTLIGISNSPKSENTLTYHTTHTSSKQEKNPIKEEKTPIIKIPSAHELQKKNEITILHKNERIINDNPVSETFIATVNLSNMNQVISNQSFIDVNFVIPTDNYFIHAYYKTHQEVEFSTDIMVLALIFLPIMKLGLKKGKKRE